MALDVDDIVIRQHFTSSICEKMSSWLFAVLASIAHYVFFFDIKSTSKQSK